MYVYLYLSQCVCVLAQPNNGNIMPKSLIAHNASTQPHSSLPNPLFPPLPALTRQAELSGNRKERLRRIRHMKRKVSPLRRKESITRNDDDDDWNTLVLWGNAK